MAGIILIAAAAVILAGYFFRKPEQPPQEKITSTGVVEQVYGAETGTAQYSIRFTGARNRSFVAKTGGYRGDIGKYMDGKLVHIRYWFDAKGRPGVEILDEALIQSTSPARNTARWCLVVSPVLLVLGILLLIL